MDTDDVLVYDSGESESDEGDTWIAEQARLVLLEDGG